MHSSTHHTPGVDGLFPSAPAFDSGSLSVGDGHRIAYTQRGNPEGIPAIVLHGGPGSGSSPAQSRFFDPAAYRIIQFDQRGCGRSEPPGEIRHNQTDHLIRDIEQLREHLGIERWLVVGGSWGATLGTVYAARHRQRVAGALLRGMFLTSEEDIQWFFQDAAAKFPDAWVTFAATAPSAERGHLLGWLHGVFTGDSTDRQVAAARGWRAWECALSGTPAEPLPTGDELLTLCRRFRVQSHFLMHQCWLGKDRVLQSCAELRGLPVLFLHGEADLVCRPQGSLAAHRCCPGSQIAWAANAGHDPYHPAMASKMRDALRRFAQTGSFSSGGEVDAPAIHENH